jgi:hypothetical protein
MDLCYKINFKCWHLGKLCSDGCCVEESSDLPTPVSVPRVLTHSELLICVY